MDGRSHVPLPEIRHADTPHRGSESLGLLGVCILVSPALLAVWKSAGTEDGSSALHSSLVSTILLLLPLVFLRFRTYLFLALPLLIVIPIEVLHLAEFGDYISMGAVAATLETSANEATEFIRGRELYLGISVVLTALYLYLMTHVDPRLGLTLFSRVGIAIIAALLFFTQPGKGTEAFASVGPSSVSTTTATLKSSYPLSFVNSVFYYHKEKKRVEAALAAREWTFGETSKLGVEGREIHVLVIGETSRAASWSVYGYGRETSPRVDALAEAGELLAFRDATSSSTQTRNSVPILLTRATANDLDPTYRELSLLSIFRRNGFEVHWLSNQQKYGNHNTIISEIAEEGSARAFLNVNSDEYRRNEEGYDETLLSDVDAILQSDAPRILVVLHTMGSHYNYHYRYPKAFERYTPVLEDGSRAMFSDDSERDRTVNSYDNSILYTDHFLGELIERIRDTGAVASVTYTADHGENLYDDDRDLWGHGLPEPSRYSVHVPLFVWTSRDYETIYPRQLANLASRLDSKISHESIFHSLPEIAGIRFEAQDPERSLGGEHFTEHPRHVLTVTNEVIEVSTLQ